uniref:DNA polymerase n=1 Tax=Vibrio phage P018-4 TaxID=3229728 RepID=A0AB39AJ56_9CAUD
MIELKNLPEEERTLIGAISDPYFLSYSKLKSCTHIFNTLKTETGLSKTYDKELWMVVTCCGRTLKSGLTHSEMPLTYKHYKRVRDEFGIMLDHKRASKVIKLLDSLQYITYYQGYGHPNKDTYNWMRSVVRFETKLTSMYSSKVLSGFKNSLNLVETLEVRDEEKRNILNYQKIKGVGEKRLRLSKYNRILANSNITYKGEKCCVVYKQVFSGDLDGAGRFYTASKFQTLQSETRKFIEIDGSECTEIDLSNLHVSILRVLQGIPPVKTGFDQYAVVGYKRLHAKMAIMCMINCKTRNGAVTAMFNLSKEEGFNLDRSQCKDLIEKLELHNNPVKFFNTSFDWKILQRLDSKICEFIIDSFCKLGYCVLSYHDSWIVKKEHSDLLKSVIKKAWRFVMKVDYDCKVKVEF